MAKQRGKTVRSKASSTRKDLPLRARKARGVTGGKSSIQVTSPDIVKTSAPAGPVPIPYPN